MIVQFLVGAVVGCGSGGNGSVVVDAAVLLCSSFPSDRGSLVGFTDCLWSLLLSL